VVGGVRRRRRTKGEEQAMSKIGKLKLLLALVVVALFGMSQTNAADFGSRAKDPGVRGGPNGAGHHLVGLTAAEIAMFDLGREDFNEAEDVLDGLGPRMNLDGCGGCHINPDVGGTSPLINPQVAFATKDGGVNQLPAFAIFSGGYKSPIGPIREVRFKFNRDGSRDGGVHNTATITGRDNADGCNLNVDDINGEFQRGNVIFRIPTPVFGAGLIENIRDADLVANLAKDSSKKRDFGISGRLNRNGNDGTVTRFGWKAQNKSLQIFSGEAYNVEMGITNESFQTERDETASCQKATIPNDVTVDIHTLNAVDNFSNFQRFLAPPTPSPDTPGGKPSIDRGRGKFSEIGCALCHTPTLTTKDNLTVAALSGKAANLYSDLALHNMGRGLADDILQGLAQGNEFRTAPLWGLGKRIFFLHDGRTTDLVDAIQEHKSDGSEANRVVDRFNNLREDDKQDLLNFLRSL
jgi:Di-haem oxidoreductase, putative peroxidase